MHVLPEAQQEAASASTSTEVTSTEATDAASPKDTGSTEQVPPEVLDVMATEEVQVLSLLALLVQKHKD